MVLPPFSNPYFFSKTFSICLGAFFLFLHILFYMSKTIGSRLLYYIYKVCLCAANIRIIFFMVYRRAMFFLVFLRNSKSWIANNTIAGISSFLQNSNKWCVSVSTFLLNADKCYLIISTFLQNTSKPYVSISTFLLNVNKRFVGISTFLQDSNQRFVSISTFLQNRKITVFFDFNIFARF